MKLHEAERVKEDLREKMEKKEQERVFNIKVSKLVHPEPFKFVSHRGPGAFPHVNLKHVTTHGDTDKITDDVSTHVTPDTEKMSGDESSSVTPDTEKKPSDVSSSVTPDTEKMSGDESSPVTTDADKLSGDVSSSISVDKVVMSSDLSSGDAKETCAALNNNIAEDEYITEKQIAPGTSCV